MGKFRGLFLVAVVISVGWASRAEAADPVGVVYLGDASHEQAATRALGQAAEDTGRTLIPSAKVERKLGNPAKKVAKCAGNPRCLRDLAGSLGAGLWVAEVDTGDYGLVVTVMVATPATGKVPAKLQGLSPEEVGAAAYGSAFRLGGGKGKGTLTVTLEPAGAEVSAQGSPLGPSPVQKASVNAGALRLEATADGYLNYSRLVAVRPGKETRHEASLEEDAGDIPLAGFGLGIAPVDTSAGSATGDTGDTASAGDDAGDVALALVPPAKDEGAESDTGDTAATEDATASGDAAASSEGTEVAVADVSPETVASGTTIEEASGPTEPEAPGVSLGVPTYATLGGGVVGVGLAAVFGVQAGGAAKAARAADIQLEVAAHNDDARKAAMTANIFYVVGAMALAAGGYFLYDDLQASPPSSGAGSGIVSW